MKLILASIKNQLKLSFSREIFKYILFVQPLMNSVIMYMIYKEVPDSIFLEYTFLGTGFLSFWTAIIFSSASDIDRERIFGTLAMIFMSPYNFFLLIFSKLIGNSLLGIAPVFLSMATLFVLRPINFKINLFIFFANLFLGLLILTLLASIFSFFFTLSKNTRLLMNNLEYPLYIISGIMFPIDILPNLIQILAKLFPLYWINQNMRNIFSDNLEQVNFNSLYCFIVIYLLILRFLYSYLIKKIRIKGTLEVID